MQKCWGYLATLSIEIRGAQVQTLQYPISSEIFSACLLNFGPLDFQFSEHFKHMILPTKKIPKTWYDCSCFYIGFDFAAGVRHISHTRSFVCSPFLPVLASKFMSHIDDKQLFHWLCIDIGILFVLSWVIRSMVNVWFWPGYESILQIDAFVCDKSSRKRSIKKMKSVWKRAKQNRWWELSLLLLYI